MQSNDTSSAKRLKGGALWRAIAVLFAIVLVAAACGGSTDDAGTGGEDEAATSGETDSGGDTEDGAMDEEDGAMDEEDGATDEATPAVDSGESDPSAVTIE